MKPVYVAILILTFIGPTAAQTVKAKPVVPSGQKAKWDEVGSLEQIRGQLLIQRRLLHTRSDVSKADFTLNRRMLTMIERKLRDAKQRRAEPRCVKECAKARG